MSVRSWADVVNVLRSGAGETLRVRKGLLPHPKTFGLQPTFGLPDGRVGDFRGRLDDGSALHVCDYGGFYVVVLEPPKPVLMQVAQEAPATTIGGGAALGAAIGAAVGRTTNATLAGAAVGALFAALLVAAAEEDG